MNFKIVLEPAEEGGFNVTVPALDGCFTQGETEEEAILNAKEAILCYMEGIETLNNPLLPTDSKTYNMELAL